MTRRTRRALLRDGLAAMALAATPGCLAPPRERLPASERVPWRNWAGDHLCRPEHRFAPTDEDALRAILAGTRGTIRPVGAGHSFSPIVPTKGTLLSLDRLHGLIEVDAATLQAEVFAGTRLHALGAALDAAGQQLVIQPDIDDQALGGALATSTHGTGAAFGSMSSYVDGLTLITPRGETIVCDRDRDADVFQAARCSVGTLGVVTRVRLANQAPERVEERTTVRATADVLANAEALRDAHRHMEFMPLPRAGVSLVVTTDPTEREAVVLDEDPTSVDQLRAAWGAVGGQAEIYAQVVQEALGGLGAQAIRSGPAFLVRAHARYSRFREMEYSVPAEDGPACLAEILDVIEARDLPYVYPLEFRYVKADDVWLSMFEGRDTATISLHQYADQDARPVFESIEPILLRWGGRPHWGKMHSLDGAALRERYAHWDAFQGVRRRLDPEGRMLNESLRTLFGDAGGR